MIYLLANNKIIKIIVYFLIYKMQHYCMFSNIPQAGLFLRCHKQGYLTNSIFF